MHRKKPSTSLLRITAAVILCAGTALIASSCSQQQAAETAPSPPPRDSPESPVRRVNPILADKANTDIGTVVIARKREQK